MSGAERTRLQEIEVSGQTEKPAGGEVDSLPESWVTTELDNLLDNIVGGGTPNKADPENFIGSIPFMTVKDMKGRFISKTVDYISETAARSSATSIVPADTLIVATRMALGKIVRPQISVAINQDLKALFLKEGIEKGYIEYFWRWRAKDIEAKGTGTTVKGIRLSDVKELKVPTAPSNEQRRIADKLDSTLAKVDACKARLARLPQLVKQLRQSILAAATSGRLTADWAHHQPFKEMKLGALAKWGSGGTPSRGGESYFGGDVLWVKTGELRETLITDTEEKLTRAGLDNSSAKVFPEKTILIAMYGATVGRVGMLAVPAATNQACAAAICDQNLIMPKYLFYLLQSEKVSLIAKAQGGAQPNISQSIIKEHEVLVPELTEQAEIIRRTQNLMALADRLEQRLAAMQAATNRLTPALLAKAFRGELVPQDPNDEPASALLARLQTARKAAPAGKKRKARQTT